MKYLLTILALTLVYLMTSCADEKKNVEKGLPAGSTSDYDEGDTTSGLNKGTSKIETRPGSVLLTGVPNIRLTTVYKVNINKRDNTTFIGSNSFHYEYENERENGGKSWNGHLMPGLEAVYGYNMVNISHYDLKENKQKNFFENPVFIRTLYYPSFSKDTLNSKPVKRDYFIVSVYNEDTNKDKFINLRDLRRLYLFNINGEKQKELIPENYSVFKSEYDSENDLMFVFAQLDDNDNGQRDEGEPIHIFWIDLKDPTQTGRQY